MSESSVVRTAVRARPGRSQDVSRHREHRSARWFCDRIQNLKRWQFGQESKQCGPRSSLVMVIQHLLCTLAQASACGYAMTVTMGFFCDMPWPSYRLDTLESRLLVYRSEARFAQVKSKVGRRRSSGRADRPHPNALNQSSIYHSHVCGDSWHDSAASV